MSGTKTGHITNLGVVSFLNSRPLIEGLDNEPDLALHYRPPAELPDLLRRGRVDVALIPVIDLGRNGAEWRPISDACISSDGETMTVRVFCHAPPEQVGVLHVDGDSHTSVVLAGLIWRHVYGRPLTILPLAHAGDARDCQAVLLIGDKVVTRPIRGAACEVDLGRAWKEMTGLPFVFAVWAGPTGSDHKELGLRLSEARDRGVARAVEIADEAGPRHGWPVHLAREYLTQRMQYRLTPAAREGMRQFLELAAAEEADLDPRAILK